jgi:hypothetical protein
MDFSAELRRLDQEIARHEGVRMARSEAVARLRALVEDGEHEAGVLEKVNEALLLLSAKVLGTSTEKIDRLVTAGLRLVFDDQAIGFETTVDRKRGKAQVEFRVTCDGIEAPPTEAYGGGLVVVIGVLLRVVAVMLLKQRRVLVLDESLSMLSIQYVPGASRLLNKLAGDLGFDILMITHQDLFAAHAKKHYEARRGTKGTEFHLVPAGGD